MSKKNKVFKSQDQEWDEFFKRIPPWFGFSTPIAVTRAPDTGERVFWEWFTGRALKHAHHLVDEPYYLDDDYQPVENYEELPNCPFRKTPSTRNEFEFIVNEKRDKEMDLPRFSGVYDKVNPHRG